MTTTAKKPKPGWKTTEAWGSAAIAGTLLTEGLADPEPTVRIASLAGAALIAIGYTWLRTRAKA